MSNNDKIKLDALVLSPWTGKKITVISDSITDLTTPEIKYISFIQEKINCIIENNGKSGTGYLANSKIHERLDALSNDSDLILFFAGVNDYIHSGAIPMRVLGDTTDATAYGSIYLAFAKAIDKWPLKTIAVMTPLPKQNGTIANSGGYTLEDYANASIAVAKKLSLPVLDLYHGSSFFPDNATFRDNYTHGGDGLHPNTLWHEKFLARKVLSFINIL